jgi:hypothetical protein
MKLRALLITTGWAVITSSTIVYTLFQALEALLTPLEFLLIFIASVLAGMLLVDPGVIVLSYFGFLALSTFIVYVCFALPAILGTIESAALGGSLMQEGLSVIARVVFIYLLIPCLMGGILGGIIGESLRVT